MHITQNPAIQQKISNRRIHLNIKNLQCTEGTTVKLRFSKGQLYLKNFENENKECYSRIQQALLHSYCFGISSNHIFGPVFEKH